MLDGEAVVLGIDGISDFNALHSRKHDHEVQFCAFDILAEGGDDLRMLPLSMRKTNLERSCITAMSWAWHSGGLNVIWKVSEKMCLKS